MRTSLEPRKNLAENQRGSTPGTIVKMRTSHPRGLATEARKNLAGCSRGLIHHSPEVPAQNLADQILRQEKCHT